MDIDVILKSTMKYKSFIQNTFCFLLNYIQANHFKVYTSGCNDDCALGRECYEDDGVTKRTDDQDFFLRHIESLNNYKEEHGPIVQISAGDSHSAALTERGSVLVWGTFRVSKSFHCIIKKKRVCGSGVFQCF